jgi:methyl-accepting chemotaxis protein
MWNLKLHGGVLLIGAMFCFLNSLLFHFVEVEMLPVEAAVFSAGLVLLCLGMASQAAAIEQTSSSLEEMSVMTSQNAENAPMADKLMRQVEGITSTTRDSINRLMEFMQDISSASDKTQKIIKKIEELAFQTNLLALEAAVEAARVGEAGAGFAVVAEEVRNLALRAAEAAKNTANFIEGTVKKVKEGSEPLEKTEKEFCEVTVSVDRSSEPVDKISAASLEQPQGIEQVNEVVSELDKLVEKDACNAVESASASEEMNAQAYQMKDFIEALGFLTDDSNGNGTTGSNKVTDKKDLREIQ